ncbi:phenoloxidase-activating factor 2 [Helicoverpa armigera]|uniref:Phenoloxidase-activating factor 2 n=1 Tax=Helicoverpa armigera TaxID=29058 RepID=B7SVM2_HELAM|nr:phenoloxidase-activating factor 2 [Helicoverpa armigera]ACI32835.1 serine proteinase-like protein 1 [Helicoverpa armigera]
MIKAVQILLLVAAAHCQKNNGDLDSVLSEIFGPPPGSSTRNPSVLSTVSPIGDKTQASTIVPPINNNAGEVDLSCTMPDGQEGECVSYYLCNVNNNTVIVDGAGVIDIRVRDGPCESYIDTCCLVPDKRPKDQPIKPKPKPDEPQRKGCGWANPDGADLRTTGEVNGETKFGEFPWMVAILKIEPVNENDPDGQKLNVYVGGGSLIHPSVVLTAAHYVASAKALRIRAGEWDTQNTKEIYPFQDRDVASVITHQDFNKGNLFYDVAVLFLAQPVDLAPNVGVACLPPPRVRQEDGTRCFATGWGKDKFGKEGRYQVILKKIELPVVKHDKCQTALRKTRLGRFFELHSTFMCAGGEPGKDTCKGDGGSPLSCPIEYEKDRYVQSGIVAWGIGCGEDGTPGVYVDVSVVRDWIDDKVAGKGYDPKTYTY